MSKDSLTWYKIKRFPRKCLWHIKHIPYQLRKLFRGVRYGESKEFIFETHLRIKVKVYHDLNSKYDRGYEIYDEIENDLMWALERAVGRKDTGYSIGMEVQDVETFWPLENVPLIDHGIKCVQGWDRNHPDLILKDGKLFFGDCVSDLFEEDK